jgi:hypothetical protein
MTAILKGFPFSWSNQGELTLPDGKGGFGIVVSIPSALAFVHSRSLSR